MKGISLITLCLLTACTDKNHKPVYKDPSQPIEKRVEDLVSRMTLEEKVLQLNQYTLGRNDNMNNVAEVEKTYPKAWVLSYITAVIPFCVTRCNAKPWKSPVWEFRLCTVTM